MNRKKNNKRKCNKYTSTQTAAFSGEVNGVDTPAPYTFLSGAEHHRQIKSSGAWMPSDEGVEEMRDFSQEHTE